MLPTVRLAALLLILSGAVLVADEPAPPASAAPVSAARVSTARVESLIAELDAPLRATRQAAERQLLELGPDVLNHLPPPELIRAAAVREAVSKIRFELERRKARASVEGSRVTLLGKKPLAEWLAEITRQTGNVFEADRLGAAATTSVELTVRDSDFWPAIDNLAARSATHYELDISSQRLLVLPGAPVTNVAVAYDGAFRIATLSAEKREIFGVADQVLRRVQLQLSVEPRLRPLFVQYAADQMQAGTPATPRLAPLNPEARYELPLREGRGAAGIQLDFRAPANDLSQTLSLSGKLLVTLAADQEKIRFTDLARLAERKAAGVARRRGGVTVRLDRVIIDRPPVGKPQGKTETRIDVQVSYDTGGPAFESHRLWLLHNAAYLEASDGTRVKFQNFETRSQSDGGLGIEYRFLDLPHPLSDLAFVYVAPTLITEVPVQFSLPSIRLHRPATESSK